MNKNIISKTISIWNFLDMILYSILVTFSIIWFYEGINIQSVDFTGGLIIGLLTGVLPFVIPLTKRWRNKQ